MNTRPALTLLCAIATALAACASPKAAPDQAPTKTTQAAAQPAKPAIPTDELVLWLYATPAQVEVDNGQVATWKDASGRHNDLQAPGLEMRPTYVKDAAGGRGAIRFDGKEDMLMRDGMSPDQWPDATVFVVAAPSANAGQFDALVSAGNVGAEDSFTGFNIDLGGKNFGDCAETYPDTLTALNTVNVQSTKTTVECGQDLMKASQSFDQPTLLTVRIDQDETSLWVDGKAQDTVGGGPDTLQVPQLRLGARFMRQKFQGYYDGDIMEVVAYDRSLSDKERQQVEAYLLRRYGIH